MTILVLICAVFVSCSPAPSAQTTKEITPAAFRNVKIGMTESQVVSLLGKPDDTTSEVQLYSGFTPGGCINTSTIVHRSVWHGTFMYGVDFVEGKVTRKHQW